MSTEHKWISTAIKHHGAFRAAAKNAGMSTEAFAQKKQNAPGVTGQRARLALTLMSLHKHDAENGPAEKLNQKANQAEANQ